MKEFFKIVFSFNTFLFLFTAGCVFFLIRLLSVASESAVEYHEHQQQLTEACYSQGMIPVTTDIGQRCADPRTLVKVK